MIDRMAPKSCKRITWIDIGKGIAIILVVIGHTFRDEMCENYFAYFIKTLIYTFHMPLFMSISGYVFSLSIDRAMENPRGFLVKKINSLMIPFVLYSMVLYLLFYVANQIAFFKIVFSNTGYRTLSFYSYLISVLKGNNPYGVHLWYIYSLFIITVFSYAIIMAVYAMHKEKIIKYIIPMLAIIVWVLRFYIDPKITIIYRTMYYGTFYILGITWKSVIIKKKAIVNLLSIFSWFFLFLISVRTIDNGNMIFKLIKIPADLFAINSIFSLGKILDNKTKKASKALSYLGRKSFTIYLIHQPFFCALLASILLTLDMNWIGILCICLLLSIAIPIIAVEFLMKWEITRKICILFGLR